MYKFNYFTKNANEAVNSAIKAAENLGHNYIGSEHILLGLLTNTDTLASQMLTDRGVTYNSAEQFIRENVGAGTPTKLSPDNFSPRCKRILDMAFQIARKPLTGRGQIL